MPSALDVADIAAEQWGLVTTAQARAVGVSAQGVARLAAQGGLERVTHGVYRVSGAPPSPLDEIRAAWLALDPGRRATERLRDESPAVVSHRSAASILGMGDLEADTAEFTSTERKQTRRPSVRLHRGQVGPTDWTAVDGLPVTIVVRTVADLAAAHIDGGHLASVVRDALTRHQVDEQLLEEALRKHAHHYGVGIGDGEALLSRFLQESGVSEPLERAVALAIPHASNEMALRSLEQTGQLRELNEKLAAIQRAIAPAMRATEQLANSPAMKSVAETGKRLQAIANSPAAKAAADTLARVQIDPSTMKALAQLTRSLQSPEMQRLAKQHRQVAEAARLATTVHNAIDQSSSAQSTTTTAEPGTE